MTLQPHDQAHFEPEGFRPKPAAHNADAALREALMKAVAGWEEAAIGMHTNIQRYAEPGGHLHYETFERCVHPYCVNARKARDELPALLSALRSPATGETHDPD